jgi:osmotically-inducible protein OsmY
MRLTLLNPLLAAAAALMGACATPPDVVTARERVDDILINSRVKSEMFAEPSLKSAVFDVTTRKGVVRLSGFVPTERAVGKAAEVAQRIAGVTSVTNELRFRNPL